MGTFGPGPFENDTALDFLVDADAGRLSSTFAEVHEQLQTGEIDATVSARAIAAAEIVASALGRGLLGTEKILPKGLEIVVDDELLEAASSAVSAIMGASELCDLWGESDSAPDFNEVMFGLMRRLNPTVPFKPEVWEADDPIPQGAVCCFCNEPIEGEAMIELSARLRHDAVNDMTKRLQAHTICMNRRVHPRFFVQDWTVKI